MFRRPTVVTAASWCQLAAAVLLVTEAATVVLYDMPGPMVASPVVLLILTALFAGTAVGLRRGTRSAYWLSLAGTILPVLALGLVTALDVGTTYSVAVYSSWDGGSARAVSWLTTSYLMSTLVSLPILGLLVVASGLLLTGSARRFFRSA